MAPPLIEFTKEERQEFASRPMVLRHRLHELPLWEDEALIALLDRYPRERLQAFTMGTDLTRHKEDWRAVDIGGLGGRALFEAVLRGRLWLNLLRVELVDQRYREMLDQLHTEILEQCPKLELISIIFGTLLISSPEALVYYHADGPHQALWHLRGTKRVCVYPASDQRFAKQEAMEAIFAGSESDEELPYSPEFDTHAQTFDLTPGNVVTWPQNAPHRVTNLGTLNVSLATGLSTRSSERRTLIYSANRFFRKTLGLPMRSTNEHGWGALTKGMAYRLCRKAGLDSNRQRPPYKPTLRVDPNAPLGVRPC